MSSTDHRAPPRRLSGRDRGGRPRPAYVGRADHHDGAVFGAWGPIERGHENVTRTFEWVGSRFAVGTERGDVRIDGGGLRPTALRVTHVRRRIDGEWRLVHRHADFPPPDQHRS